MKRLIFIGWGRHGKDYAAELVSRFTSLRYGGSTSWAALPLMAKLLGQHPQVCWERRHQHRELWKKACDAFRKDDPLFLIKRVLEEADIVPGIRGLPEIRAARKSGLFTRIIWVDARDRVGHDPDPTVDFGPEEADQVLFNNTSPEDFKEDLIYIAYAFGLPGMPATAAECLELVKDL